MTIRLLRHAKAGSRHDWAGADDQRPLSKSGRRQAVALADMLGDSGVTRIVSSPYVRCRQTVEPLSERLQLPVELSTSLAEGADVDETFRLMDKLLAEGALLCSHGDVIPAVLNRLARSGVPLVGDRAEKGSVWELDVHELAVTSARYVAPPAVSARDQHVPAG